MRRYVIGLVLTCVLVGSLFKAYTQTGNHWMAMYASIGIVLFGIIGTLAINRLQTRTGLKELEAALKSLEPDAIITDWAFQPGERPDYLLVGPGGIVVVTIDETAQSTAVKRAASLLAKSCGTAQNAVRWVHERLGPEAAPPVSAVVVLTRRRALAEQTTGDVPVLNPEELAGHIRSLWQTEAVLLADRIKLTRALRVD